MAVLYDFSAYHAPRLLRSFSQQTGGVVCQLYDLGVQLKKVGAGLRRIRENQRAFAAQLNTYILKLEETNKFARRCSAACELSSIEQMIEKRDQIIRDRLKKRAVN